jgi:hypothetical protein
MGIPGSLSGHRPQAETLVGVECARFQAAIIKGQRFNLRMLHVKLAVIRILQSIGDDGLNPGLIAIKEFYEFVFHHGSGS